MVMRMSYCTQGWGSTSLRMVALVLSVTTHLKLSKYAGAAPATLKRAMLVQRLMAAHRQELAAMEADREDLMAVLDQLQSENKALQNSGSVGTHAAAPGMRLALEHELELRQQRQPHVAQPGFVWFCAGEAMPVPDFSSMQLPLLLQSPIRDLGLKQH